MKHKKPYRRQIFDHFKVDMSDLSCKTMQRCPKCLILVVKEDLIDHLRYDCKFWDVHFMKCGEYKGDEMISMPHDPVLLGCMRHFLKINLNKSELT